MNQQPDKACILLVDDKPDILLSLQYLLSKNGYHVIEAGSPLSGLELVKSNKIDLVLLDMNYSRDTTSGEEGLYIIEHIQRLDNAPPVIAMTAWSNVDIVVKSIQQGAADFIEKPWDNQRLLQVVRQVLTVASLQRDKEKLSQLNHSEETTLIAESPAMQSLLDNAKRIADTHANILLTGENGTGKSSIAQWIHQHSAVANNAFVSVNMGAIPENLFESEMFGHSKGAFTDAKEARIGRIELAEGGTLFLDEIGTLPERQQSKLLRVLESKDYEKVGSSRTLTANFRLISATNADIKQLLLDGRLRSDLYYRINTFSLRVPSLRERPEDILALSAHFLSVHGKQYAREDLQLSPSAQSALMAYEFPGNIRELSHIIERAALLTPRSLITCEQLTLAEGSSVLPHSPLNQTKDSALLPMMTLAQAEEQLIQQALESTEGSVLKAATLLGLSKSAIYRRLEKYNINYRNTESEAD